MMELWNNENYSYFNSDEAIHTSYSIHALLIIPSYPIEYLGNQENETRMLILMLQKDITHPFIDHRW